MKKKIIIGITASKRKITSVTSSKQDVTYIPQAFIDLFKEHKNIIPIILYPDMDKDHAKEICAMLDGLILSSGEDVHPSNYNSESFVTYHENNKGFGTKFKRPETFSPNIKRDHFEIELYHAAKEKNIPILGICRGMQVINVAEKGTLFQEIPETKMTHFLEEDGWIHHHEIDIEPDCLTFDIFKKSNYSVSSIHHQAVDKVGNNLKVVGKSPDGITEIIEHNVHDFIIGFQGHIEKITNNFPLYQKIIHAFVERARLEMKCLENY